MSFKRHSLAKHTSAGCLLLFGLLAVHPCDSQVNGSIAGLVRDEAGSPQMGAVVALVTSDGRQAQSISSDYRGWFQFTDLFPGVYSIEVKQASFSPATRDKLHVISGKRTFLDVSLRGLFASLQLAYGSQIRDMSEKWKWVLRAKHSRRNVLRVAPTADNERTKLLRKLDGTFTDTRAYAEFSAGQGVHSNGLSSEQDLGTAFAVATTLFGNNDLTVSGNRAVRGTQIDGGASSVRATYSKQVGPARPALALTIRQLQSSSTASQGIYEQGQSGQAMPHLETLTLEYSDTIQLMDSLQLKYGLLFESVNFINRLQFASPYGQAVYQLAPGRELVFSYASGVPPTASVRDNRDVVLQGNVRQLGMFPRVALVQGNPTVQRVGHVEAAYRESYGKNMIEVGVYRDSVRDAAVTAVVPEGVYEDGNIVPDLHSATSTLNAGMHGSSGARISYTRKVNDRLQAALGYSYTGVLAPTRNQLMTINASELREIMDTQRAHVLLASVMAGLPQVETVLTSSYQWSSRTSVMPIDPFNDFSSRSEPGLNIAVRQPLPIAGHLPGKFVASAEFRNLFKSGHTPLQVPDGRLVHLLQAIRSYSGALSYIF